MNSMTQNKKGLISLLALLITIAMLITGTYAWFTDTATVKGNKVYAGALSVDIVASGSAIAEAVYGKGTDFAVALTTDTGLAVTKQLFDKPVKSGENGANDLFIVTGKEVPLVTLANVEPGSSWPVSVGVMNSGELAISYSAGFSIDNGKSLTGLQTVEDNKLVLGDKYASLKQKLEAKQVAKKEDGTLQSYTPGGQYDLGGHLEDVLEVYKMTDENIEEYLNSTGEHKAVMTLLTPGAVNTNYIGKITEIMHCNDTAYLANLDTQIAAATAAKDTKQAAKNATAAEYAAAMVSGSGITNEQKAVLFAADQTAGDALTAAQAELDKLTGEKAELAAVATRLANAATGYCVPESKVSSAALKIYGRDGVAQQDSEGADIEIQATNLGKAYFVIHMPGSAGDIYQYASLTLNVGVTANQVELDEDGIHVMIYDDAAERAGN